MMELKLSNTHLYSRISNGRCRNGRLLLNTGKYFTYIHTSLIPPREDQREWHRMTRMTGPDCVVMCNLINTYIPLQRRVLGSGYCPSNGRARRNGQSGKHQANREHVVVVRNKPPQPQPYKTASGRGHGRSRPRRTNNPSPHRTRVHYSTLQ